MRIDLLDTDTGMGRVLGAPLPDRPALLGEMLEPVRGMYAYAPVSGDLPAMHHAGSGFRVDRDDDRVPEALERLRRADAWTRIRTALESAAADQLAATPGIRSPEVLQVVLVLGDPADEHFMHVNLGMVAAGASPGYLWICLWPSDENLARIEATAVHELHHQLRYHNVPWDPTVGEQVVAEGLADAFARARYGDDLGYTRIGVPPQSDLAAQERVLANLDVRGMQQLSAWVHGDATTRRFGGEPVGLPTGIGYAVGNRLVDAYLAATGKDILECLAVESAEVIRIGAAAG